MSVQTRKRIRFDPSMSTIICHDCNAVQREPSLELGESARCWQCGAVLIRSVRTGIEQSLALMGGALLFFVLAQLFTAVTLEMNGHRMTTHLLGAVEIFFTQGLPLLGGLVFITVMVLPALQIGLGLYLLVPLWLRQVPPGAALAFRALQAIGPWSQLDILVLGVLVAMGKLSTQAHVSPGMGFLLLCGALVALTQARAALDPRLFWRHVEAVRPEVHAVASPRCPGCDRPCPMPTCPRCGAHLTIDATTSLTRTTAFLAAAAVLYFPANLFTMMSTTVFFQRQDDTIFSGVVYLWVTGSWPLALLVLFASVLVPVFKIFALSMLVITARRRSDWRRRDRTRLYRFLELVGRWSMLDIYVAAFLCSLVQVQSLARVDVGPAALAFGAVVVLTMLASMSFDPRLLWERAHE
jgi:paraquat-inducible protein A